MGGTDAERRQVNEWLATKRDDEIAALKEQLRIKDAMIETLKFESLPVMQRNINLWQSATFPYATKASIYTHTRREWREFKRAVREEGGTEPETVDPVRIGLEMADVVILFMALCAEYNIDLWAMIRRKMAENVRREWQKPDAEGVVEHVR